MSEMKFRHRDLLFEILFSRKRFRLLLILCSALSAVFGILSAVGQREFIDQLLGQPSLFIGNGWSAEIWLGVCFLSLLLSLAGSQAATFLAARESFWMQRHLAQKLYRHVLNLQSEQMKGRTVGEVVSIYTTDVPGATIFLDQSLPQGFTILFPLILVPWVLVNYFGLTWSFVLLVLTGTILINFFLAFRQSRFFFLFKTLAADRIGLANEWIQNIRTLRVIGWTEAFEKRIFQVRQIETGNRIKMLTNGQSMNALSSSTTYLLNLIFVLVVVENYKLAGNALTPGTLLALLWIVGVFLTRPFRQLPWFFTFLFDGWTSLKRVHGYLSIVPSSIQVKTSSSSKASVPLALNIENLNLELNGSQILSNIYLQVPEGQFVAVVGEVGSGKTSLLLSLLGETSASFGAYSIHDQSVKLMNKNQLKAHFSFVAQEGFVISGSLRENVALTYGLDHKKDKKIIHSLVSADFDPGRERLAAGLETDIGERGVNLSGGQRQRVSLARVDFEPASILLFDDCFSALDVDTENRLIQDLFLGHWKEKTKIISTHRLSILDKADTIYFLKDGRINGSGSLQKLVEDSEAFREYMNREKAASRPDSISQEPEVRHEDEP